MRKTPLAMLALKIREGPKTKKKQQLLETRKSKKRDPSLVPPGGMQVADTLLLAQ